MAEKIQLIVGLGNPGREYEHTRHNAGALLVEALARQHNAHWQEDRKFSGMLCQVTLGNQPVKLIRP